MAATLALKPNPVGGGGCGSGGPFSPLTLFECTITNATMLVDSMPVRDLLAAFRIVSQLGAHVAEVLDPQVGRLADTADDHAVRCCRRRPDKAEPTQQPSQSLKREYFSDCDEECEDDEDDDADAADGVGDSLASCAASGLLDFPGYCADESSNAPATSGAAAAATPRPVKVARRGSADASASETGELSVEWKGILRKAYRQLKEETSSNVFDFALPYSARVNLDAANRVIDKARNMTPDCHQPANLPAWTKLCRKYTRLYFKDTLKRTYVSEACKQRNNGFSNPSSVKLNRRQKAYESLRATLDQGTRERYERVLTRDYTSSDEEGPDLDAGSAGDSRVRRLAWESGQLAEMKSGLDRMYYTGLADGKQRAEMDRLRREPDCVSSRPPPLDCPQWARSDDA